MNKNQTGFFIRESRHVKFLIITYVLLLLLLSCEKTDPGMKIILDPAEQKWLSIHRDELYFAPDPFYAPFEFYDEKDKATKGLAHDYLTLIENKIGVQFKEIHASSFNEILQLAKQRKVAIVNAATKTPDRSEYLLFTEPIVEIKNIILVRKGTNRNLSLEDLVGKKVSLVQGYAITEYMLKKYPGINYDIVPADLNAILNVSYRISDAAIIDMATASFLTEREGISNIEVAGDAGYPIKLAIGSRNDWPELNSILNRGFSAITAGERNQVYHKWIGLQSIRFVNSMEFRIAAALIILLSITAGGILLWNKQLQTRILLRTSTLNNAMTDLKESESRLKKTQEISRTGSWELDVLSGRLKWSDEVYVIFGLAPQEFAATHDAFMESVHPDDRDIVNSAYLASIENNSDSYEVEHRIIIRSSGDIRYVYEKCEHVRDDSGAVVRSVGMVQDITERKLYEEKIKNLLTEKELLLKEVHNRIKNNMNTIKGLLALQLLAEENPSAVSSLRDTESRVQSMIMLYDRLYLSENYQEMSVKAYLQPLAEGIVTGFSNREIVRIDIQIDDFILNVKYLSPLGIIVNELLTNVMKYAFPGRNSGELVLSASLKNSHVVLAVQDNGIGIPDFVSFENTAGFGLELVYLLAEQIGGSIKIERDNGTKFVLEFNV